MFQMLLKLIVFVSSASVCCLVLVFEVFAEFWVVLVPNKIVKIEFSFFECAEKKFDFCRINGGDVVFRRDFFSERRAILSLIFYAVAFSIFA